MSGEVFVPGAPNQEIYRKIWAVARYYRMHCWLATGTVLVEPASAIPYDRFAQRELRWLMTHPDWSLWGDQDPEPVRETINDRISFPAGHLKQSVADSGLMLTEKQDVHHKQFSDYLGNLVDHGYLTKVKKGHYRVAPTADWQDHLADTDQPTSQWGWMSAFGVPEEVTDTEAQVLEQVGDAMRDLAEIVARITARHRYEEAKQADSLEATPVEIDQQGQGWGQAAILLGLRVPVIQWPSRALVEQGDYEQFLADAQDVIEPPDMRDRMPPLSEDFHPDWMQDIITLLESTAHPDASLDENPD